MWCNCGYNENSYLNISNIDNGFNAPPRCFSCGNIITNDTIIMLLLREVIELKYQVEILGEEKRKREDKELEEELKEQKDIEMINRESERFNILDL